MPVAIAEPCGLILSCQALSSSSDEYSTQAASVTQQECRGRPHLRSCPANSRHELRQVSRAVPPTAATLASMDEMKLQPYDRYTLSLYCQHCGNYLTTLVGIARDRLPMVRAELRLEAQAHADKIGREVEIT